MVPRCAALLVATVLGACSVAPSPPPPLAGNEVPSHHDESTEVPAPLPAPPPRAPTDLFTKTLGDPKDPAVIYVHGGPGGNGTMFEETIAPALVAHGFYAVSYDQRGAGRSPKATGADLTVARFVQDLDDVIVTLGLVKPILFGHSFGGWLSLKYVEAHPDVPRGTVLVAAVVDFPDSIFHIHAKCIEFFQGRPFGGDDVADVRALDARMFPRGLVPPFQFSAADVTETMDTSAACRLHVPTATRNALGSARTWGSLMATSPNKDLLLAIESSVSTALQENDHVFEQQLWPVLEREKGRVFAIYGSADGLFSKTQLDRMRTTLGDDRFVLIENAAHATFVDDEERFLQAFVKHAVAMD